MVTKLKRPLLRYHGGKWTIAKWIISHFPEHRAYIEPYGGGGSVLLRKIPSEIEVYNDLNSDVVNLFRVLRDEKKSQRLLELIYLTPYSKDEFDNSFHRSDDDIEDARRLLCLGAMGVGSNSTARIGRSGFRNYSRTDKIGSCPVHQWYNYPDHVRSIIDRLRNVVIENRHAFDVMLQHDSETSLHYVDPPYLKSSRSDTRDDYTHELTENDHIELSDFLHKLKGHVVLSGYQSDLYNDLYAGWDMHLKDAYASGAKKRTEVLWIKKGGVC